MKFTRTYSRTYGNNIWSCGDYQITRQGSSYWGFTGYELSVKGKPIAGSDTFQAIVKIAEQHAKKS